MGEGEAPTACTRRRKRVRCSREPATLTVSYQKELWVAQTHPNEGKVMHEPSLPTRTCCAWSEQAHQSQVCCECAEVPVGRSCNAALEL